MVSNERKLSRIRLKFLLIFRENELSKEMKKLCELCEKNLAKTIFVKKGVVATTINCAKNVWNSLLCSASEVLLFHD